MVKCYLVTVFNGKIRPKIRVKCCKKAADSLAEMEALNVSQAAAEASLRLGLGRIAALHHRSPASYQIH
jgi:hypothetical protein